MRSLLDIFTDLGAVTATMTDEQRSSLLEGLGIVDKEAKNAVSVMLSDNEKLARSISEVSNSAGETERNIAASQNTMMKLTEVWNSLKNVLLTVGEIALPVVSAALSVVRVVADGVLAVVTGIVPAAEVSTHYYLTLLFPVTMGHYWFLTAYLFLYILLPFVGMGLRRMTKQQFQVALVLLFVTFCLLKSVLPFRLEEDGKGYDCLWYLCVFCAAAYLRRFGIPFLQKKSRALLLYLIGIFGTFGEAMLLHLFYLKTGSLELILKIPYEYNHIFPFLASLGLFCLFLDSSIQGKIGSVAVRIAPYTLGVYLLHENLGVRYAWQKWLGVEQIDGVLPLLLWTVLVVVVVFVLGILVDFVRKAICDGLHKIFLHIRPYRSLTEKIRDVDTMFKREVME